MTEANKIQVNVAGWTFSNYQPLLNFKMTFRWQKIVRKKALTLIVRSQEETNDHENSLTSSNRLISDVFKPNENFRITF